MKSYGIDMQKPLTFNCENLSLTNLITNSGFGVWSNSTLETTGSAIITGDDSDFDTPGNWTSYEGGNVSLASVAGGNPGNCLQITANSNSASHGIKISLSGLVVGKTYKFTIDVKAGTYASTITMGLNVVGTYTWKNGTLTGSWVTQTLTFIAGATSGTFIVCVTSMMTTGQTFFVDTATLYEAVPGCVAADVLACDGWSKDSTLDVYREHNGDNTKDGSFYSLKLVPSAADDWVYWPANRHATLTHLNKFAGRTVTFGAWVKTSTASHVWLRISDGIASTDSSYHTGGGDWEWLEITQTMNTSPTIANFLIYCHQSSGIAYVSQPMLVFGKSIGEGNYSSIPGEIIYFETNRNSVLYDGLTGRSDVTSQVIDIEADSNFAIPKQVKAIFIECAANDSGSAGEGACYIYFRGDENATLSYIVSIAGFPNDKVFYQLTGWCPCSYDGFITLYIAASGAGTFDIAAFRYLGVELW